MKTTIMLKLSLLVALGNVPVIAAALAAQGRVELRGTVSDETGAVLAAVDVVVERSTGQKRVARTDERGRYRIADLTPGSYTLRVEVEGFAPFAERIDLSEAASLDITLKVFISERVEVKDDASTISVEPESNLSAIVLTGADLDALPDDPDELLETLRMMAGATGGRDEAAIYVDGFREDGRLPPKEAILRIRLNSNPFSAEYNEPGNSRVEVITKPGSDTFHGGLRFNFNDESLNARNAFAPSRAPLQVQNYGANLSGPVIRNRWGFFLSMDRRAQDENEVVNATILNPVSLAPEGFVTTVLTPTRRVNYSLRTDFLATPKHTLGFQYRRAGRKQLNEGLGGGFDLPERAYDRTANDDTLRFYLTSIISERAVNELRLELGRDRSETRALTDAPAIIVLDAFGAGGNQGSLFEDETERELEFIDNLTYTYGKHSFKLGVRAEGESRQVFNRANFGGTFTFGTDVERSADGMALLDASGEPTPISALELYRRVLAGVPGHRPSQFSVVRGEPFVSVSQWEMGWFAQDDWRISPRLTVSYGLRHEFQTNLDDRLNVAPRFGLAWQPDRKGASSVRFGAGVFYDYVGDRITFDTRRLDGERQQQFVIRRPAVFPEIPDLLDGADRRHPTIRVKAEDLAMPYSIISTVSYERLLPARIFASAGYTWTRGVHLLRTRNINAPTAADEDAIIPRPDQGPILQFESTGLSTRHELWLGFRTNVGRFSLFGRYTLSSTRSDTDGAGQLPADSYDLATEWGRSSSDARHQVFIGGSFSLPWQVRLSPFINASSGRPFNITTGRDNNHDTFFNDRPSIADPGDPGAVVTEFGAFNPNPDRGDEIIPRNFGQGPGSVDVNLSVSKTFSFGPPRGFAARAAAQEDGARVERRVEGPRGTGRGGRFGGRGGRDWGRGGFGRQGEDSRRKYSLTMSVNTRNLFNSTNLAGFNGVLTSAIFGTANRALASRRVEASLSFRF